MKKIRIGVIGAAGRGGGLIREFYLQKNRAVVVGGADISQKSLELFKKNIGPDVFTTIDYRELLKRKDIDAVVIGSPDFTHEEYSLAALKAGKHVYLEKPMAISTAGCDRILKAWKRSKVKLMIGFNMRHMAIFKLMKKIIDSGKIGVIKTVWVRHFVGFGGSFYYHDWHAMKKNVNSLLLQKGSHDIDMIHYLTGSYTKKVAAFGSLDYFGGNKPDNLRCPKCKIKNNCIENDPTSRNQCCFRKEVNVEDNNEIIMELENGIKASYLQCHFAPEYFRNYTLIGTKGRIENLNDEDTVMVKLRGNYKMTFQPRTKLYKLKKTKGSHFGADAIIVKDFLDFVQKNKKPVSPALAGRMSVAVGCAAAESLRNGGKLKKISKAPGGNK